MLMAVREIEEEREKRERAAAGKQSTPAGNGRREESD